MGSCDILSVLFGLGVWCIAYISVAVFASFRILHSVFSLWLFFFLEDFCFVTMGYAQLVIGPAGSGKVFSCQFCFVITMRFWLMRLLGGFFFWISQLIAHLCMNTVKPSAEQWMLLTWILLLKSLTILWLWVSYSINPLGFQCLSLSWFHTFFFSFAVVQISESLFLWKM